MALAEGGPPLQIDGDLESGDVPAVFAAVVPIVRRSFSFFVAFVVLGALSAFRAFFVTTSTTPFLSTFIGFLSLIFSKSIF